MKIAIVTGASSGMGREFVYQLEQYVKVDEIWAIARRQDALESLKNEVSVPLRTISLDLIESSSFDALAQLLQAEQPDIKLLVNAAGFGKFGDFDNITVTDDCRMINLNCTALVQMTRLCIPYMRPGSHILQLDSLSAFQPVPYITTYGATKAFVLSYSRAMNRELADKGIRMMALNPGWVKTEFFNHATQTNGNKVQYFDRLYEADFCVSYGLKCLYHSKRDYAVPGFFTRMQVCLVKLLPHGIVMRTWLNQQKNPKNNQNLIVKSRK